MGIQICFSKSTAHGLMNIGNAERWPGKLLWACITLATLAIFSFHTYLLYYQLLEEKVLVSTFPDSVPFLQPDIVFCSERFFARDFINYPPENEYQYMSNVSKDIQDVSQMYEKKKIKTSYFIWDSLNYHKLYRAFFQRKHQLFLSIRCNLKSVNIDELVEEPNFVHFACFRLRRTSCELNSPLDTLIVKFYSYIYGVNITYSRLNVTIGNKTLDNYLFIQKEPTDDMEDGIHVYFVQHNEGITEAHGKVTASVNEHTIMKIRSTKFLRISTNKTTCKSEVEYGLFYNLLEEDLRNNPINMTVESVCKEIYFQNILKKQLDCVIYRFPISTIFPPNLKFCGDLRGNLHFINILSYWDEPKTKIEIISECKPNVSCNFIRYSATVNYNHWPRTSTMKSLFKSEIPEKLALLKSMNKSSPGLEEAFNDVTSKPSNINSWKRNFIKVSISPGEYSSTVIEESPAYSYKNFFSDVGGIMGFYMGASLLTLCELFRLLHCGVASIAKTKAAGEDTEVVALNEVAA